VYSSDEGRPKGMACREEGVTAELGCHPGACCSWCGTIQMWKEKRARPRKLGPFSCVPDLNLKILEIGLPSSLIVERQERKREFSK